MSKSLQEATTQYLPLEKAILAILHATKKLSLYFQAHTVIVFNQLPLQALLRKSNYTGRVAKLGTMLGAFDIRYLPQTAIKSQVLANLVAEFTEEMGKDGTEEGSMLDRGIMVVTTSRSLHWELYLDGATN